MASFEVENWSSFDGSTLQIGTYVGLIISFLDSNYTNDSIWRGYFWRQNIKPSSYQKTKS